MKLTQEEREDRSDSPIWQQLIPTTTPGTSPDNDVHIDLNEEKTSFETDPLSNESNGRWCQFSRSSEQATRKNHRSAEAVKSNLPTLAATVKSPLTYSLIK